MENKKDKEEDKGKQRSVTERLKEPVKDKSDGKTKKTNLLIQIKVPHTKKESLCSTD